MKICSRPPEDEDDIVIGTGAHQLRIDDEQLELLAALLCTCRLGQQKYSNAAYEMINMIENVYGADWMHNATDKVDPHVSVEDAQGGVVFSSIPGTHYITLEV